MEREKIKLKINWKKLKQTKKYNKEYRLKNKDYFKKYINEYNQKNKDKIAEYHKNYMKNYYATHPEYRKYVIENSTKNHKINSERTKSIKIKYNHSVKGKLATKKYNNLPKIREYHKNWKRNNPKSNTHYTIELQIAMNNVRLRDKNTCQWYNCKLTFKQAPIHVHHIFPKKEYPELQLIEKYMICYCANHHGLFHRFRGDPYSELIHSRNSNVIDLIIREDL